MSELDDLERRAAQGAQIHAQLTEARQRELTTRPVRPELNPLATRSLIEAVPISPLGEVLAFLLTLLAVGWTVILLRDDVRLAAITGVAIGVLGTIAVIVTAWRRRARQLRQALDWFGTLPFTFDRRHYLEELGQDRSGTRLELQIDFTSTPSEQEMEMFANAASGSAAIAHRESQGTVLLLTSIPLRTSFGSPGSGIDSYYSNRHAHAWMLGVTDGALRLIHQRRPIYRVTVKMESVSIME